MEFRRIRNGGAEGVREARLGVQRPLDGAELMLVNEENAEHIDAPIRCS